MWRRQQSKTNRGVLFERLDQEVDHQRADAARRSDALATRASVLVASASLLTTLQAGAGDFGFSLTILLTVLAAAAGVGVLFMRSGEQLDIALTEQNLWSKAEGEARRELLYQKLYILRADEKLLRRRASILNTGFALLTASLVAAAFHLTGAWH